MKIQQTLFKIFSIKAYIKSHLELQREITLIELAPSPYFFVLSICLAYINMFARFDENPANTLQDIKKTKRYGLTDGQRENSIPHHKQSLRGYLELQREITLIELASGPYFFVLSICLAYINMFARFDENPANTLQDIKKTKRYGRTDNVKTVYPTTNKVCGGIIMRAHLPLQV